MGSIVNRASAAAVQFDPDLSNNVGTAALTGMAPASLISKRSFLSFADPNGPSGVAALALNSPLGLNLQPKATASTLGAVAAALASPTSPATAATDNSGRTNLTAAPPSSRRIPLLSGLFRPV
jgi:hypothetical protein